jgi:hypothetical protein
MATTATHNSSRATDESSELLEQHHQETAELESNTTADYQPAERHVGIALADADEPSASEIQPVTVSAMPSRPSAGAATTLKKSCGVYGSS